MKKCTKCRIDKELKEFSKNRDKNDGFQYECKKCFITRAFNYYRTKNGLAAKIYKQQKVSSKKRNHIKPDYTLLEFREWLFYQSNFEKLYNNWAASGYLKDLVPSPDRLDDYKPYTLSNLQLITWKENNKKFHKDRLEGINNKQSKSVIGKDKKTGRLVEFYSIHEAERQLNISIGNISQCLSGDRKSAGGYTWL